MTTIDELVGYAKANADAARTKDEQQTWAAHHRHALAAKAEIERLRAVLQGGIDHGDKIGMRDILDRLAAVAAMDLRTGGFLAHTMDTATEARAEIIRLRSYNEGLTKITSDMEAEIERLRTALTKVADLRYSEAGEPLDEAIEIADRAINRIIDAQDVSAK